MTPRGRGNALPLTAAQRGTWLAQAIAPRSAAYTLAHCLEIPGPVRPDLLARAIRLAEGECGTFDVRLAHGDDGPVQRVVAPGASGWETADLRGAPDPPAAARAWMEHDRTTALDLERDTLALEALLRVGDDRHLWYRRCHHILNDPFGTLVLTRRIAELYAALLAGEEPGGDALGRLTTLLAGEAAYRDGPGFAADRAYWTAAFADRPAVPSLAPGPARTVTATPISAAVTLPAGELARLCAAGRPARAPWTVTVLAALAAFLHGMTGLRDLTVGVPVAARHGAGMMTVPGMVANRLPLRLTVDPGATRAGLLRHVSQRLGALLAHQRYPYDDLRRDLGLRTADEQLFGMLADVAPTSAELRFAGHTTAVTTLGGGPVRDLDVRCRPAPGGSGLRLEFLANPDRYTVAEVAAHQNRFVALLRALAAADPEAPLARLPLTTAAERAAAAGRAGRRPVPPRTFPGLFEEQAARSPAATAVRHGKRTLGYAALNARANRLARTLAARGAGPERVVALVRPPGVETLVAALAVLKCGAALLPLDPDRPGRNAAVLRATRPLLVLDGAGPAVSATVSAGRPADPGGTGAGGAEPGCPEAGPAGPGGTGPRPAAADPGGDLAGANLTDAERGGPLLPGHPAFVLPEPDGPGHLVIPHAGLAALVARQRGMLAPARSARVLMAAAPDTDAYVRELSAALLTGGCAVLPDAEAGPPPGAGPAAPLAGTDANCLLLTPAELAAVPPGGLPADVTLIVGGAPCPPDLVARWSPGRRMVSVYRPAGSAAAATAGAVPDAPAVPAVGRPVPGTRLYVLDDCLRPVPPGVAGEIYLAGPGLARGYLGRPARTAAAFVADPFGPPGTRMQRTGDLARWRADGVLEYLGRAGDRLTVPGTRAEPGVVERVLAGAPGVDRAVVLGRRDRPGGAGRVVGYLVAGPGAGGWPDRAAVRARAAERLPRALVPDALVVLDTLPLAPDGTVDRARLPAPGPADAVPARAPRDEREATLCAVIGDVLGVGAVGADDDFFDLGGDSLLAVRFAERAGRAGLGFGPGEVFVHRTAAALAARTGRRDPAPPAGEAARAGAGAPDGTGALVPLDPVGRRRRAHRLPRPAAPGRQPAPPTGPQAAPAGPGGESAYNVQNVLGLRGGIDAAALYEACRELVRRHPALRAGFQTVRPGRPLSLTGGAVDVPFTERDLRGLESGERNARLAGVLAHDRRARFDLAALPPLRFTLARVADEAYVLVLTGHHLLFDDCSLPGVLRELFALYAHEGDVSVPPL